jgi:hypothetical protein
MLQQSSRYLFKQIKQAKAGKQLKTPFSYISHTESLLKEKNKA